VHSSIVEERKGRPGSESQSSRKRSCGQDWGSGIIAIWNWFGVGVHGSDFRFQVSQFRVQKSRLRKWSLEERDLGILASSGFRFRGLGMKKVT